MKIEVITDQKYLLPDNEETVKRPREILAKEGLFGRFALYHAGPDHCPPLGRGRGGGLCRWGRQSAATEACAAGSSLRILVEEITTIPVIVDAGIARETVGGSGRHGDGAWMRYW